MKSKVVIAAYRPNPGKQKEAEALVRKHHPTLLEIGLVTERAPVLMRAADGTLLEVFEWVDANAAAQAHENPVVAMIWEEFAKVCEFVSLDTEPGVKPLKRSWIEALSLLPLEGLL